MANLPVKDADGTVKYLKGTGAGTDADPFVSTHGSSTEGPQKPLFLRRMDETGDGTGNDDMAVDGSSTPVTFKIAPGAGEIIRLSRTMLYVQDTGAFDATKWGNGITLTNGQKFEIKIGAVTTDLLGFNVKTLGDVASIAFDVTHFAIGTGDEFSGGRLTFTKMGQYVRLDGDNNDELLFTVNDDQTDLTRQHIMAQGYYE